MKKKDKVYQVLSKNNNRETVYEGDLKLLLKRINMQGCAVILSRYHRIYVCSQGGTG
jgi:hypothetical protein